MAQTVTVVFLYHAERIALVIQLHNLPNFLPTAMKLRSGLRTPDRREGRKISGHTWQDMNENTNNANKGQSTETSKTKNMTGKKRLSVEWPDVYIGMFH